MVNIAETKVDIGLQVFFLWLGFFEIAGMLEYNWPRSFRVTHGIRTCWCWACHAEAYRWHTKWLLGWRLL